ncbi:uncharacterized protein LOC127258164 isoform X2 [Andrographis paniculata]|uniref:uncharacterized protein LOC127258164 isoform X2 n=1 Tax=Andrographis paniculata TaxID=175694 RepID=UPI0021E8F2F5|nr:uncharacterized protein LOC127258164 isoform X2 [Andrographis paniculata]
MLQRQIMFKQLQELQRRQQLQELGDARSQDYINQLVAFKQASGIQFAPIVNGAPGFDSQMLQTYGSGVFQGSPNGLVLSQSQNHTLGPLAMSQPQCDGSLYGSPASNVDRSLNLHPHLQGGYSNSASMLTMNVNNIPGLSPIPPLGNDNSFVGHQGNYFSDQIGMAGDFFLTDQVYREKNLFGEAPVQSLNTDILSADYPQQGFSLQRSSLLTESTERYGHTGSHGTAPGQVSKMSQKNDSLDLLEQKILFNTDGKSWVSSFGSKKIGTPSLESTVENPSYMDASPSIQSGSWSALMQSAVAETSSSDTAMQEEWSGLSFQNPEPSTDNQPMNFINTEISQNNWIERNIHNVSSPCSDPEPLFQKSNKNYNFLDLKQSELQTLNQKDEFQSESSHVSSQYSPGNTSNLVQTSLHSQDTWPTQCHDLGGPTLPHGSAPVGSIQKSFNQMNQMNVQRYSVQSDRVALGDNIAQNSALLNASSNVQGESFTAQSEIILELLGKDAVRNDRASGFQFSSKVSPLNVSPPTDASAEYFAKPCDNSPVSQGFTFKLGPAVSGSPDSHSLFPSLSMGSSCMTSLPNDYNQRQTPVMSSYSAAKYLPYASASSQDSFQLKRTAADGLAFQHSEEVVPAQSSRTSDVSQGIQFLTGLPIPLRDNVAHGGVISQKPFPSNLLHSQDSVAGNQKNGSGAPNLQPNQNYLKHGYNVEDFGIYSGTSGYYAQTLEKESLMNRGWLQMPTPESMSTTARLMGSSRNHLEADVVSGSLTACTYQKPSNQAEQNENTAPAVPPGDIRSLGHFLHQSIPYARNSGAECSKNLLLKCDNQQSISSVKKDLFGEQKSLLKDKAKNDMETILAGTSPGSIKGWNFSQEAQNNQLGRSVSDSPQDYLQMEKSSHSGPETHSICNNEGSNVSNQSQISLQMAPSWFKRYGTLNGLPPYNPKAATNSAQSYSGLSIGNVLDHSLPMQLNSAKANHGSGSLPSSSAALMVNKNLPIPIDFANQNLTALKSKKRKLATFDMLSWHKEVNFHGSKLQSISMAGLEWALVLNRRQEEAKNDAEVVKDMPPAVRSKRRLIFTTQLMQQIFRPPPVSIISTDATLNYDVFAYSAARLELGDACNLTSKPTTSLDDVTPDKLKTSKGNGYNFSKAVEGFINRVKKLEGDRSRLDKICSLADFKAEIQDLEKFSTINRFAKFHFRANIGTVDPTSSSGQSSLQKATPQHVTGDPMARTLPETVDCLSL